MVLVVWVFAVIVGCTASDGAAQRSAMPSVPVQVWRVAETQGAPTAEVLGTVRANNIVAVQPEVAGRVVSVSFSDGDRVQQGQVLVRLEARAANATLRAADATLQLATSDLERAEVLFGRQQLGAAERDALVARRDIAQAERDRAADQLRQTVVRAPLDGRLGLRQVAVGDMVTPQTVITELVDADPLRVEGAFPERLVGRVAVGQPVTFRPASGRESAVIGVVSYVAPKLDLATRAVRAQAVLQGESDLVPGMTGSMAVVVGEVVSQVWVPAEAVLTTADEVFSNGIALDAFRRGPPNFPVIVVLAADRRDTLEELERVRVRSAGGALVPLSTLVTFSEVAAASSRYHFDRALSATNSASLDGVALGDAIEATLAQVDDELFDGFRATLGGSSRAFLESS